MKKILIALDYNPTAQKVAEVGHALAKAMNAETILIHIITDPVYYSSMEYSPIMGFNGYMDMNQMQFDNNNGLKNASNQFLEKSKLHLKDKTIKTEVREGDVADTILTIVKELNIDIIVMGSHSRRWLEEILLGSVTEKVLHNTRVPLFIIPTKKHN